MNIDNVRSHLLFNYEGKVLLHGTRLISSILKDDELARPVGGVMAVHLTSCPTVAARAALRAKPQGPLEYGRAAIIVLDPIALQEAYAIDLHCLNPHARRGAAMNYLVNEIYPLSAFIVDTCYLDEHEPDFELRPTAIPDRHRHRYAYPTRAKTIEFMRRRAEVSLMDREEADAFAAELTEFLDGLPWDERDRHHELRDLRRWLGDHVQYSPEGAHVGFFAENVASLRLAPTSATNR